MTPRRILAVAVGVALVLAPLVGQGQQVRKMPRVGVLAWEACPDPASAFGRALGEIGYTWGQTILVVCRSAGGDHGRLTEEAAALAREKLDVIAALSHITAYAARRAAPSTPIVMIASGDPVRTGLVASLSRPGGHVTGLTYYSTDLVEKRLQLLKEMVPGATRIAVLENPHSAHVFGLYGQDAERGARHLGLRLLRAPVSHPRDLDRAFEAVGRDGAQGLLVLTDPMLSAQARRIGELAAQYRLPAMYWASWFVESGGLAAYSADYDGMVRRAVYYVDRILKGARPADLPVEQPTTFELFINLKAATALGLTIPPSLLARADRVLQ